MLLFQPGQQPSEMTLLGCMWVFFCFCHLSKITHWHSSLLAQHAFQWTVSACQYRHDIYITILQQIEVVLFILFCCCFVILLLFCCFCQGKLDQSRFSCGQSVFLNREQSFLTFVPNSLSVSVSITHLSMKTDVGWMSFPTNLAAVCAMSFWHLWKYLVMGHICYILTPWSLKDIGLTLVLSKHLVSG